MKNLITKTLATTLIFSGITASSMAAVIYEDDFSSGSVILDPRVDQGDISQGWAASSGWSGNGNVNSAWEITGGQLQNTTADAGAHYIAGETAAYQWIPNTLAGSSAVPKIRIEFDYGVGAGDSLTFHLWAITSGGTPTGASIISNNQGWSNGNTGQNETADSSGNTPWNLLDGSNQPSNSPLATLTDATGSYSSQVILSSFDPSIQTIGDIDGWMIAFGGIEEGGGTTFITNVRLSEFSAPEPSSLALLGLGAALIAATRKRKLLTQ